MTTLDAYQAIAIEYDSLLNPMLSLEARIVERMLPALDGLLVADIAAGTGRWASHCRELGARTIAIDFSPAMLAHAPPNRVLADVASLPLRDESVDVAICAFGIGYAPACLPEIARVTRAGGTVIASDVHPDGIRRGWRRGFRGIEAASTPYELAELGAPGLALVSLFESAFDEPERAIFEQAGRGDTFDEMSQHPAVFVAHWIKSSGPRHAS